MTVRVASLLLLVLVSGSLQGCFPVVATGVGAGVMMAQDRRTKDAIFDDQKIETAAAERIDESSEKRDACQCDKLQSQRVDQWRSAGRANQNGDRKNRLRH